MDGELQADNDWHVGCVPMWEYDPEEWDAQDQDFRDDYTYYWESKADQ